MGQYIDLERWKRRQHFELFRRLGQPFFSVTVEVDVTRLRQHCRASGASFYLALIFVLLRAINESEALRLRLRDDGVWLHEQIGVGTTILRPDETFGFARFDPSPDFDAFQRAGAALIADVKSSTCLDALAGLDDVIYHSTLPWLRFTSFTNALSGADSIPRVTFGKCVEEGTVHRMPLAVEVHHALADGIDVARFVDAFQRGLDAFPDGAHQVSSLSL